MRHDATQLLSANGSLEARVALEARLDARLPREPRLDSATPYRDDDEARDLALALVSARNWRLTDDEVAAWHRRCREMSCSTDFYVISSTDFDPSRHIAVYGPSDDDEGRVAFGVEQARVDGIDELLAKLGQYPTGTPFYWWDHAIMARQHVERWTRAERTALFEQARVRAAARGIVLTRTIRRRALAGEPMN